MVTLTAANRAALTRIGERHDASLNGTEGWLLAGYWHWLLAAALLAEIRAPPSALRNRLVTLTF
jgi:hypothetical protein